MAIFWIKVRRSYRKSKINLEPCLKSACIKLLIKLENCLLIRLLYGSHLSYKIIFKVKYCVVECTTFSLAVVAFSIRQVTNFLLILQWLSIKNLTTGKRTTREAKFVSPAYTLFFFFFLSPVALTFWMCFLATWVLLFLFGHGALSFESTKTEMKWLFILTVL